jgi:hypothetical protein
MKVIKGVLKEELTNSLQMEKSYQRELAKLPVGTLVKKKIRDRDYYYLAIREGGRVIFTYKGKIGQEEIKKYEDAKKYRAKYRKLLSETKKQIKFLRGTLRGKKSV